MKIQYLIALFLTIFSLSKANATHIVGGEIFYDYLGNDEYLITLEVYRDCDPNTNTNNTDFDEIASIGIFQNGQLYDNVLVDLVEFNVDEIPVTLDNPCFVLPPQVCVERAVYEALVVLPESPLDYDIVYQRCCRNPTIINLLVPEDSGATFTTSVPGTNTLNGDNSSPRFTGFPPVALCTNAAFSFDHSATDPDGDSLVYEFCTPFHGASPFEPAPNPPAGPPFMGVTYAAGYSAEYPISSDPAFSIDPVTGELAGTPNLPGQYVIGICVREFRNGVEINRLNRDFQFNVVACDPVILSAIPDQSSFCDGLTFQFDEASPNGTFFFWDFGDPTTEADTSSLPNPLYTYPDTGYYEVTLIANPGWSCADTATAVYGAFPELEPVIIEAGTDCEAELSTYDFIAGGQIEDPEATYSWDFGNGTSPQTSSEYNPQDILFPAGGTYNIHLEVTANGCTETADLVLEVPETPVAIIPSQETFCDGFTYTFENASENAVSFYWDFGVDELDNDFSTLETPTFSFPEAGAYAVNLTAFNENSCLDIDMEVLEINTLLAPSFDAPDDQCFNGNSLNFIAQGSAFQSSEVNWNFGENASPSIAEGVIVNGVQFTSPGTFPVTLNIAENGCERHYTDSVTLVPNPVIDLDFEGAEGCSPLVVQFENLSEAETPLTYMWEFGDGGSSEEENPTHVYTTTGYYDVKLIISSVLGCVVTESMEIEDAVYVYPNPQAGFIVEPTELSIFNPTITVTDTSGSSIACFMDMGDGTEIQDCEFEYTYEGAGIMTIVQTIINDLGCADEASRQVIIRDFSFYLPNAFTPNEDGLNDVLLPVSVGVSDYDFKLFDRWGQLIFETNDIHQPWLGNVKGGDHYAEPGVYVYKAKVYDSLGIGHEYEGHVTLIR